MASFNKNAFNFIAWIHTHSRNPWQEVDIFTIWGNKAKKNLLSTSIMQSYDLIGNANSTNSDVARSLTGPPVFTDDGALHMYTFTWHPDYIEILCDGVRV
jgi:hypothetical protein